MMGHPHLGIWGAMETFLPHKKEDRSDGFQKEKPKTDDVNGGSCCGSCCSWNQASLRQIWGSLWSFQSWIAYQ